MKKTWSFVLGSAAGALIGLAVTYLFGPAAETKFDKSYASRWDHALAEGRQAALAHEQELRRQLTAAKQPRPQLSSDENL